ncbi:hypothetical protein SK128_019115, partial [Halocaridina rubra]
VFCFAATQGDLPISKLGSCRYFSSISHTNLGVVARADGLRGVIKRGRSLPSPCNPRMALSKKYGPLRSGDELRISPDAVPNVQDKEEFHDVTSPPSQCHLTYLSDICN